MTAQPRIAPELAIAATLTATAAAGYALAAVGVLATLQPSAGLHGTLAEAAVLAARNGSVAALFVLAAHAPGARLRPVLLIVDALGLAILMPVTLLAGQFLAAPGAWRFFVHAPLELGALAAAFGWWWRHHGHAPQRRATARRLALVLAAITVAALLETFLTPTR